MPHRLLQAMLPEPLPPEALAELEAMHVLSHWQSPTIDETIIFNAVVEAGGAEALSDWLKRRYEHHPVFRENLYPLEATVPLPEEKPATEAVPVNGEAAETEIAPVPLRISRDELMSDVLDATQVTRVYLMLAFVSAVVAAGGMLRDNVAIVIGGMVIAPLLGPNMGLCLAATLADLDLAWTSLKANASGVAVALIPSVVLGYLVDVNLESAEIASRTQVGLADLAIAIASGAAGVLAFTTGLSSAVIGVMVAVALMPPLVNFGLLLGSGQIQPAAGALLLLVANVICVNLTGTVMFYLQGVRPQHWWETKRAARATRISIVLWVGLLGALVAVITLSRGTGWMPGR